MCKQVRLAECDALFYFIYFAICTSFEHSGAFLFLLMHPFIVNTERQRKRTVDQNLLIIDQPIIFHNIFFF